MAPLALNHSSWVELDGWPLMVKLIPFPNPPPENAPFVPEKGSESFCGPLTEAP